MSFFILKLFNNFSLFNENSEFHNVACKTPLITPLLSCTCLGTSKCWAIWGITKMLGSWVTQWFFFTRFSLFPKMFSSCACLIKAKLIYNFFHFLYEVMSTQGTIYYFLCCVTQFLINMLIPASPHIAIYLSILSSTWEQDYTL